MNNNTLNTPQGDYYQNEDGTWTFVPKVSGKTQNSQVIYLQQPNTQQIQTPLIQPPVIPTIKPKSSLAPALYSYLRFLSFYTFCWIFLLIVLCIFLVVGIKLDAFNSNNLILIYHNFAIPSSIWVTHNTLLDHTFLITQWLTVFGILCTFLCYLWNIKQAFSLSSNSTHLLSRFNVLCVLLFGYILFLIYLYLEYKYVKYHNKKSTS